MATLIQIILPSSEAEISTRTKWSSGAAVGCRSPQGSFSSDLDLDWNVHFLGSFPGPPGGSLCRRTGRAAGGRLLVWCACAETGETF